jgi:hypothetical protein
MKLKKIMFHIRLYEAKNSMSHVRMHGPSNNGLQQWPLQQWPPTMAPPTMTPPSNNGPSNKRYRRLYE